MNAHFQINSTFIIRIKTFRVSIRISILNFYYGRFYSPSTCGHLIFINMIEEPPKSLSTCHIPRRKFCTHVDVNYIFTVFHLSIKYKYFVRIFRTLCRGKSNKKLGIMNVLLFCLHDPLTV